MRPQARLIGTGVLGGMMAWLGVDLRQQCNFGASWLGMSRGFFWSAVGKGALLGVGAVALVLLLLPILKRWR